MPALAVLSGIAGAGDLILAPPPLRPTYISTDVAGLLTEHPAVDVHAGSDGWNARCRAAEVVFTASRLDVVRAGPDPVDLLRAAIGAAWAGGDVPGGRDGIAGVLDVLAGYESAREWAR